MEEEEAKRNLIVRLLCFSRNHPFFVKNVSVKARYILPASEKRTTRIATNRAHRAHRALKLCFCIFYRNTERKSGKREHDEKSCCLGISGGVSVKTTCVHQCEKKNNNNNNARDESENVSSHPRRKEYIYYAQSFSR